MSIEDRLRDLEITQKSMKHRQDAIYVLLIKLCEKNGIKVGR